MELKLISKNNIGTVVLLLLVIVISQAKAFNFLIDSALGRAFLIIFILCLSYCNKILGVVGVLFIIIMFNNSRFMYEGFETTRTVNVVTTPIVVDKEKAKQTLSNNIKAKIDSKNNESTTTTTTDSSTASTSSSEGFDILGIENNIKRGKQSNSIPVNKSRESSSIAPYDSSSFLGNFSLF
jgi:hypothetical protein